MEVQITFMMWQTRKMESIFKLKDKNTHPSHVIYKGKCISGQTYISKTACNLEVRVNIQIFINMQSEPAKPIRKHPNLVQVHVGSCNHYPFIVKVTVCLQGYLVYK